MSEVKTSKPNVSKVILDRLQALDDLPHFPDALAKLERALAGEQLPDVDEVVQMVAQDPRLAAGLIGVVNTPKYSTGQKITELADAVNRIGIQDIRVMAHAINYKSAFKSKPPFSEKQFLKHSLLSAFIAQNVARSVHLNTGEAFLCGLMKDIGIYLLAVENREQYQNVIDMSLGDVEKLSPAEAKIYTTQHPIMSARLLQQWKFPKDIILGVANHHSPEKAQPQFQAYAYLTYLAEYGAYRLGVENGVVTAIEDENHQPSESLLSALEYFGLAIEVYDELLEQTSEEFAEMGMG